MKTFLSFFFFLLTFFIYLIFVYKIGKKKGKEFETIVPRTGEVITRIAEGAKEDIDVAVKAARGAFDYGPWPRMPGAVRYHFSICFSITVMSY